MDKCESPIEVMAIRRLREIVDAHVVLDQQVVIGNYRADIVAAFNDKQIVIECDGREWHENNAAADRKRDTELLHSGVAAIYRVRGCDLLFEQSQCFDVLLQVEPGLHTHGAETSLEGKMLASSLLNARRDKPIYRCKFSRDELESLDREIVRTAKCHRVGEDILSFAADFRGFKAGEDRAANLGDLLAMDFWQGKDSPKKHAASLKATVVEKHEPRRRHLRERARVGVDLSNQIVVGERLWSL